MDSTVDIPKYPKYIEIELTNRCNKRCRMCQRRYLAVENYYDIQELVVQKILSQVDFECQMNFGGLGESLLAPNLSEILSAVKQLRPCVRTGINTNGSFLTPEKYPWLTDGSLDFLEVSLNAPNAELYKELCDDDEYDLIVNNTLLFLKYRKEHRLVKPHVTVHSLKMQKYQEENKGFVHFWEKHADFTQLRELSNWGGFVDIEQFGYEIKGSNFCIRPFESVSIDSDGFYRRCCSEFLTACRNVDDAPSIWNMNIKDYWVSPIMSDMRRSWLSGVAPVGGLCANCYPSIPNSMLINEKRGSSTV